MARQKGQAEVEKQNEALAELKIEYVSVDDVIPNDYNPNRQNEHEFNLLCRSMQEDGFTQPVIMGKDGHIVDGEHRWRAAKAIGLEKIPVVRVPMEAAQARIATLRHNRARGTEDIELSVQVLRDLEKLGALDWAADSLELDDAELQRLLDDVPAPEALADENFSEAWIPTRDGEHRSLTAEAATDSTALAADRIRAREQLLREAKTDEERQSIRRDRAIYRISLTFADEEAEVVKFCCGDDPANNLLVIFYAWAKSQGWEPPKPEEAEEGEPAKEAAA